MNEMNSALYGAGTCAGCFDLLSGERRLNGAGRVAVVQRLGTGERRFGVGGREQRARATHTEYAPVDWLWRVHRNARQNGAGGFASRGRRSRMVSRDHLQYALLQFGNLALAAARRCFGRLLLVLRERRVPARHQLR